MQLSASRSRAATHRLDGFHCGEPSLDDWLKRRALTNHLNGASRTFVVVDPDQCVFGYYALAAGAVTHREAPSTVRRNMPDPVPVMVLARLAVDARARGNKLGAALLQDAVTRVQSVAENVGVRALLVHALNARAKQFYEHYGFRASPMHPMTLMLPLKARAALGPEEFQPRPLSPGYTGDAGA
ncbi:GNAT family N-acetyltransferase [Cupriavidus basilensis]|uniref:GNAT family N-acetyltransferase n=2 Tax=Cupriavidus basilensis TaxID=68895 RepID=A0ABT6ANR9_9BURK|nr:GNAT family N-acetyltransferase [Cupriavidus basilensis]MDF3833381.1 GNAT family N-acetyltransferase [Cupriavidus basilensis]